MCVRQMVEALYDCEADHNDELGFKEGEKIVVTKKMNRDWWVSGGLSHEVVHTSTELCTCD